MFISKALQNMRGDPLGSAVNTTEGVFMPRYVSANTDATDTGFGVPYSTEYQAAIVFSNGDAIPDSVWHTMSGSLYSIDTLRAFLAANFPTCVMTPTQFSTGLLRQTNKGGGERVFEFIDNALGSLPVNLVPFNRMYIMMHNSAIAPTVSAARICSCIELTIEDLQKMGAPIVIAGDGSATLTSLTVLNNIVYS